MGSKYWERAWSLVEGCTPVSPGCAHCWAAAQSHLRARQNNPKIRARYGGLTDAAGRFNGTVRMMWDDLEKPLAVKRPTVWSVWNDLFHEAVPRQFVHRAFTLMCACPQHRFLILTKRPERIYAALSGTTWADYPLPGVWLGTTVERQEYVGRLDYLRPLAEGGWHTFVSCEPCLSAIDLRPWLARTYRTNPWLSWIVCGAETGPHARPMELDWARSIARDCVNAGVPLFVKAVSGGGPIPPDLDIHQLPWQTR